MSPVSRKRLYIPQHTYRGKLQRDDRFDNVRGFLIMLVVIGHFLLPVFQTRLVTGITYAIYVFHMPCFVMVSGYYAKSIYKNGKYRWGKVIQMLWLFVVYECILWITEALAYGITTPIPNFFRESGAPWYLLCMAYYYLTLPLFHNIDSPKAQLGVIIAMILFASFGKYIFLTGSFLCLDRAVSFLPFFYMGYYGTKTLLDRFLLSIYKRPVQLIAAVLLLIIFLFTYDFLLRWNLVVFGTSYNRYRAPDQPYIWFFNIVWYVIAFIISLGFISSMLNRRMLIVTGLGRNTLQIYFMHRPIRDIMMYFGFYNVFNPHSKLNVILLVLFSIALTILLGGNALNRLFILLKSVFDPLLEKADAL
ncbi:MAG: acyltransferase family protein [Lachnospiraceae bacterium]|nr:acyltransferase family protein [Lachnospiraceae bacterium]